MFNLFDVTTSIFFYMSNNSEHCCLSCGIDISDKRIDAKYCSDRCRMRYRRAQKNSKLLNELIDLFTQLPNHSVQQTDSGIYLQSYNASSRKTENWRGSELKSMSNQQLKDLVKKKRVQLAGDAVGKFVNNLFQKS